MGRLAIAIAAVAPFVATAAPQCVNTNTQLGTMVFKDQKVFSCTVPAGYKHDVTVNNPKGAKLIVLSTDGNACQMTYINNPSFYDYGSWSTFGAVTDKTITFTGAPCNSQPCCTFIVCDEYINGICNGPISASTSFYDPNAPSPSAQASAAAQPDGDAAPTDPAVVGGAVAGVGIVAALGGVWYVRKRRGLPVPTFTAGPSYARVAGIPVYAAMPRGAEAVPLTGAQAGSYQATAL